ncbi:hypothetical protein [Acinetobacter sp. Ac_5812]|uniref:hypothetical protein n=1 Tax=Acinetobacter sp. Ac_5812 TaxID=1848937 RepID=UPI00148F7998|nr:hypothetical protein [Acinetobacter sp. Ac_5812]NNP70931.1 hypothetical protein [Acinetobacter sp. Ac_5812]
MIKYLSPFKTQALAAGDNLAYTNPANTATQIRALSFHNTTAGNISVEVYVIPTGVATTADAQRLVKKTLAQNESYLCPEVINHNLVDGERVVLKGTGVNAKLSVAEQPV